MFDSEDYRKFLILFEERLNLTNELLSLTNKYGIYDENFVKLLNKVDLEEDKLREYVLHKAYALHSAWKTVKD